MKDHAHLTAAANENFVVSYLKLIEHCPGAEARRFGGVVAFVSGLPISLFNGCVVVEPSTPDDLDGALAWVGGEGVPHRVFLAPELAEALGRVALAHGLRRDPELYPGMVLHPVPEAPAAAPGVTVAAVDDVGLEAYLDVLDAGGLPRSLAERLFTRSFAEDPDVRLFVGRLDGQPVGGSLALRSGGASGIYAVGTHPAARRRGVGAALTWAAVEAGRAWGKDTIVLQSTPMAVSLYEAMGFRTYVPYTSFTS